MRIASLLLILAVGLFAQEPPVFHSGTRLVEVEVIVRGKPVRPPGTKAFFAWAFDSGPPFGPPGAPVQDLSLDDFKLFDNGKPQPIAFVHGGPSASSASPVLPPGVVSNRIDSSGHSANNATVILIDQLNTSPDLLAYERKGVINVLRSLSAADNRVALYTMGTKLHILQDFTGDQQRLAELAAKLEQPHGAPELNEAFKDFGGLFAWTIPDGQGPIVPDPLGTASRKEMTTNALRVVIQHLARVSGRKNLVWLTADPPPPAVTAMMLQANITLYSVMVRGVGCFDCDHDELDREHALTTGGRTFFDALDLAFAVRTAEEDSQTAYTLGFYPSEEMLDGKYHHLTVKLRDSSLELHYRNGYIATKLPPPPPRPAASARALLDDPLQVTGIGLTARLIPDPKRPGMRKVELNVDLRDVHLQPENGRATGAFEVLLVNQHTQEMNSSRIEVNVPAEQLAKALEKGYTVVIGGVGPEPGELRAVVRDPGANMAGSLRIPVTAEDPR